MLDHHGKVHLGESADEAAPTHADGHYFTQADECDRAYFEHGREAIPLRPSLTPDSVVLEQFEPAHEGEL